MKKIKKRNCLIKKKKEKFIKNLKYFSDGELIEVKKKD